MTTLVTTGWQGLWTNEVGGGAGVYTPIQDKIPRRDGIKTLMNRSNWRATQALFQALIGAASGGNATRTHNQIAAPSVSKVEGGLRTVETITDVNRNTTAADIAVLKEMTQNVSRPTPMPKDLSGNGGPAY